jgi:hypothetical protein
VRDTTFGGGGGQGSQAGPSGKAKLCGLNPQARTIPTERPPLVGEVSANFGG